MTSFCTYFDRNYLPQGLALYRSLIRQDSSAELWMLCLDEETRSIVTSLNLAGAHVVTVGDLLQVDPRLITAKRDRSALEFYYACTPQLIRYVAERAPDNATAYIDADVFFFGSASSFHSEDPNSEILLVEHRSGDPRAESERGRFNLCFVQFASTARARRALEWWCNATIETTAMDARTWGDQKYLDHFPELFSSVGVLRSPATTLAPWNVWQHELAREGNGQLTADGVPLAAYHFARLLVIAPHFFSPARREWLPRSVLEWIYRPYMGEIRGSFAQIRAIAPDYSVSHMRHNRRGLILGLLFGRVFYEGNLGVRRVGIYIPNTRKEIRARRDVVHRRKVRGAQAAHG